VIGPVDRGEDDPVEDPLAGRPYRWTGKLTGTGLDVVEEMPGRPVHRTLLLPYLADTGSGAATTVQPLASGVRLSLGEEWVEISTADPLERCSVLPEGYESRRGWCGLVRLDLAGTADALLWRITSSD